MAARYLSPRVRHLLAAEIIPELGDSWDLCANSSPINYIISYGGEKNPGSISVLRVLRTVMTITEVFYGYKQHDQWHIG